MKTLLAAPFVGEIGWELLSWQGRVRHVFHRGRFEKLVVLGAAGKAAFYADMPFEYRPVDLSSVPGAAYEDRRLFEPARELLPAESIRAEVAGFVDTAARELTSSGCSVEVLWPEYAGRLLPVDSDSQIFAPFERPVRASRPAPHVVLVQRTRRFRSQDNWPNEAWEELARRLGERGVHTSVYPSEAEAAIETLCGSDLAVGQSTGGLHLASLCGCPAVVWGLPDSRPRSPWEMTDRQRYQTLWNPLGTPVDFHGRPQPPVPADVAGWIGRALQTIGRRTGTPWARAAFRCGWRLRASLDRRIVRRPWFRNWPWPVQTFIRYRLV